MINKKQITLIIINSIITILIYIILFNININPSIKLLLMFLNLTTLFIAPIIIEKMEN